MYTLLLIDDETGQLTLLADIVHTLAPDFRVITHSQPEAALKELETSPVDAVLTDIRMPGVDGLSLCRRLRETAPGTILSVISAYSDFQYAQQAIAVGAAAYLVKPVSKQSLLEFLEKIRTALSRRDAGRQRMQKIQRRLANYKSHYVEQEMRDWLCGTLPENESKEVSALFCEHPFGMLLLLYLPDPAKNNADLLLVLRSAAREAFSGARVLGVSLEGEGLSVAVVLGFSKPPDKEAVATAAGGLLERLSAERIALRGALTHPADDLVGARSSLFSAAGILLESSFPLPLGRCLTAWEAEGMQSIPPLAVSRLEETVCSSLRRFSKEDAKGLLSDFSQRYAGGGWLAPRQQLVQQFLHLALSAQGQCHVALTPPALVPLQSAPCLSVLCTALCDHLLTLIDAYHQQADGDTGQTIQRILAYLQAHLGEELSLESVAELFHFNKSYLSNLFPQHAHTGFKEYLTSLRIEKAKELLCSSSLKVYEVAAACGYPDATYFVKLFKKEVGLSPNRYRGLPND